MGKNEKAVYAVVDGKQRLQTLFQFVDGEISVGADYGDTRLNGKSWPHLDQDQKQLFWNYVIPVEFLNFARMTICKR